MSSRDAQTRFHEKWLDLAQPIEGLVFSIDGDRALVSSANFTDRGHDRHIETGVLLHERASRGISSVNGFLR